MRIKQHALFRLPQYYGHREKLRLIGREADLEKLNLEAQCSVSNSYSSNVAFRPEGQYITGGQPTTSTSTFTQLLNSEVLLNFMNKNGLRVLSVQSRVQFSSRAYLCAQKSPHALRPVSQKFLQRCR